MFMIAGGTGAFSGNAPSRRIHSFGGFSTQGDYLSSQSYPVTFTIPKTTAREASGSFTVALSNDRVSMSVVNPQPASLQVAVSTLGNYTGSIQLGCSGLPAGISCSFSLASLTVNATKVTITLLLSVPAAQSANDQKTLDLERAFLLSWGMLSIFGIACGRKCGRGPRATFLTLALLCSILWDYRVRAHHQ